MPPPTLANSAIEEAPNPNPATTLMVLEDEIHDGEADETDAHDADAHDRAGVEGEPERGVESFLRLDGGAGVGAHCDAHADVPGEAGAYRAEQVGDGGAGNAAGAALYPAEDVVVYEQREDYADYDHEDGEQPIFAGEEGVRALSDGVPDEAHLLIAFVGLEDAHSQDRREPEGHYAETIARMRISTLYLHRRNGLATVVGGRDSLGVLGWWKSNTGNARGSS